MKKSFMTRVLAMGLSFAMAFSLSAATNVTTASAAAKKVGVTTMMKVSTKSVTEGKTVKTYMNSTALKKYRIKKVAKLSAVADKYIDVDVITTGKKARQGLEITAHEGAVTAAKLTKKGVYVTIYFAQTTSATKAAKATAKKYAKLKVAVQAKPVEKLTMTAAATGVKKIAVTFNKAVDTTTTKLVVKKGSATPTITPTFAADGKSAEIAMGTKLTEGTYTVEATVGEEVLTADIAVENERLDSFALVSNDLVASAEGTTAASIKFKALNQYEEMMPADNLQATCSFGKVSDTDGVKNPTADKVGTIYVTEINTTLAIVGQTGTLVIVDKTTGKSLNTTVTYQSKAVASAATVAGVYSDKTEKVVDGSLKAGDKVTNNWLMINIKDQYGSDMSVKDIAASECEVSFNPASVLTNVSVAVDKLDKSSSVDNTNIAELSKEGTTYILIKLTADKSASGTIDKAGTLNLTVVSANKGVLVTPSVKVEDKVIIASLSVSPADTLYADEDNKLVVEAVDTNGNAVTKYDDLKKAIKYDAGSGIKLKKNSDETGTFYYNPGVLWGTKANKWKDSKITTLVMYANDTTSGNYIVKTVNVTYYAKKQAWAVAGVGDKTVTAVVSGGTAEFDLSTLKYEDQYGNPMAFADIKTKSGITACVKDNTEGIVEFASVKTNGAVNTSSITSTNKKLSFTGKKKGTANVYFLYRNPKAVDDGKDTVSDEVYDLKVPVTVTTSNNVVTSDLTLTINDGKTIYAVNDVELKESTTNSVRATTTGSVTASAVVTAKINGKNVVLPDSQFTIINPTISGLKAVTDTNPAKTETKTITAVVQTEDGPQTVTADVQVSNADAKAAKIEKADSTTLYSITTTVTHAALFECIKVTDQYGNKMEKAAETVMKITATGTNASNVVVNDGSTQKANISFKEPGNIAEKHTVTVTYEYGGLSLEVDVTLDPGAKPAS